MLKPQVTIHNHGPDREIVVGVDGPESRIMKMSPQVLSRELYLKSGAYKYAVAAEHIRRGDRAKDLQAQSSATRGTSGVSSRMG